MVSEQDPSHFCHLAQNNIPAEAQGGNYNCHWCQCVLDGIFMLDGSVEQSVNPALAYYNSIKLS